MVFQELPRLQAPKCPRFHDFHAAMHSISSLLTSRTGNKSFLSSSRLPPGSFRHNLDLPLVVRLDLHSSKAPSPGHHPKPRRNASSDNAAKRSKRSSRGRRRVDRRKFGVNDQHPTLQVSAEHGDESRSSSGRCGAQAESHAACQAAFIRQVKAFGDSGQWQVETCEVGCW